VLLLQVYLSTNKILECQVLPLKVDIQHVHDTFYHKQQFYIGCICPKLPARLSPAPAGTYAAVAAVATRVLEMQPDACAAV
jgi:hypothetical protein